MKCSGGTDSSAGERAPREEAGVGHDDGGQDGAEQEPALEHPVPGQALRRAGGDPEDAQGDGGDRAGHVQGPPGRRSRLGSGGGQEGDGDTRHEVEQAGVGAVVDPGGIAARDGTAAP